MLGYVAPPPPEPFASWEEYHDSLPAERRDEWFACSDPTGAGPRLYFQRVPEGKVAKNRVHLDVRAGTGLVGAERQAVLEAEGDRLVGAEGWSLPRPRWTTAEDGRPLLLGLRAEDVSVEKRGETALAGELYGLEPLGDRTVVDVKVGSETVKVKARPTVTGTPGERVSITVDLDRAHIFDAGTGLALSTTGR